MTTFLIKKGGELDPRGEGEHTEAEGRERGSCCSQYSGNILNIPNSQGSLSEHLKEGLRTVRNGFESQHLASMYT